MSKPRTFLSSTCYDLADARAALGAHLEILGFEVLLSERSTFGVAPKQHAHDAALQQVDNADYFVLIIGGRRGSTYVGSDKSITNEEYRRALRRKIPIMVFLQRSVAEAERAYGKNPSGDFSYVLDDRRIFDFIAVVRSQSEDNWVKLFDTVEDIKAALTAQFACVALLYSRYVIKSRTPRSKEEVAPSDVTPLPSAFDILSRRHEDPAVAASLIQGLRSLHGVIASIRNSSAKGAREKLWLLWAFGRYADTDWDNTDLSIEEDRFKQYAWGSSKGGRVFRQIEDFGVRGRYEDHQDAEGPIRRVVISFAQEGETCQCAWALKEYVADLLKPYRNDERVAFDQFVRGNMSFYATS